MTLDDKSIGVHSCQGRHQGRTRNPSSPCKRKSALVCAALSFSCALPVAPSPPPKQARCLLGPFLCFLYTELHRTAFGVLYGESKIDGPYAAQLHGTWHAPGTLLWKLHLLPSGRLSRSLLVILHAASCAAYPPSPTIHTMAMAGRLRCASARLAGQEKL